MEDILLQLYNNPDVSLGVHGTAAIKGKENETASKILKEGLMCRYGDIRRTVAFQNKGQIHAHGNIEYEELINYKYGYDRIGYINEEKQEGTSKFALFFQRFLDFIKKILKKLGIL